MKWMIGALVALLLSGIVWEAFALAPSARTQTNLESLATKDVQKGTFVVKLSEIGEVQTLQSTNIAASFDGTIYFLHDEGFVNKGDLLVQFDTQQFEQQLSDRKTQLDLSQDSYDNKVKNADLNRLRVENALKSAQDSVDNAQTNYEQSQKNRDRTKALVDKGLQAQVTLEQAEISLKQAKMSLESSKRSYDESVKNRETQLKVIELDLQSGKTNLEKQKRDYEDIRKKIEQSKINAPTSGLVVLTATWKRGSFGKWTKGDSVFNGASIMNFPDMSVLTSNMKVDEVDIDKVKMDLEAEIRVDALPGKVYHGKVYYKGSMAVTQLETTRFGGFSMGGGPQTKGFEVRIKLSDADDQLRPGMTTKNDILLEEIPDAVWVPLEALFDRNGEPIVYLKDAGKFRVVPVLLGKRTATEIQITEGLKGGETVFLTDPTKALGRYQTQPKGKFTGMMPGGGKGGPGGKGGGPGAGPSGGPSGGAGGFRGGPGGGRRGGG